MPAPSKYEKEALAESEAKDANFRWIQARTEAILKTVTAHDVVRRNGIKLRSSKDAEEQFPCPFHGVDRHPSARIYPSSIGSPSHVWCFVCRKRWDAIGLWRKFTGDERFTQALAQMERTFGIMPPERPPSAADMLEEDTSDMDHVQEVLEICERRLRDAKPSFDMRSHLILGSVLDKVRHQLSHGQITTEKAQQVLQQVLDKIGQKVRG